MSIQKTTAYERYVNTLRGNLVDPVSRYLLGYKDTRAPVTRRIQRIGRRRRRTRSSSRSRHEVLRLPENSPPEIFSESARVLWCTTKLYREKHG